MSLSLMSVVFVELPSRQLLILFPWLTPKPRIAAQLSSQRWIWVIVGHEQPSVCNVNIRHPEVLLS